MIPRHGRGRQAPLAASPRRAVAVHLQDPHVPGGGEDGAPREPAMEIPPAPLRPVLKGEGTCQSTAPGLFTYLKMEEEDGEEEEEEEEETTELGAFSTAPTSSTQLAAKQSGPAEAHEVRSYLKEEEGEEKIAEGTSPSPPHSLALPATPPGLPSYASPAAVGRKFHRDLAGMRKLHFFTPSARVPATFHRPKRGREHGGSTAGVDWVPPPAPKKTTSAVWDYFTLDPSEPCVAVCSACQKRVRRGKDGGTRPGTTALHKHLRVHHGLHLPGVAVVPPSPLLLPEERPPQNPVGVAEPAPAFRLARPERSQPCYPPTHPTAVQLASATAWMLAVDMQPPSYVESEGFRRLMATAQPLWRVPGRAFFATKAMPELSNLLSRTVRQALALSLGRTIHIAIDSWPGPQGVSYMSVTGLWVTESEGTLSRQHAVLSVCAFEGSRSEEDVGRKLREVVQDWLFDLRTGVVVSDHSTNWAEAVRKLHLKHVPCLAGCLKTVTKAFLGADPQVARLLKKSRRICGLFDSSAAARRRLSEAQASSGVQPPRWTEAPARCGSTVKMLEGLSRQQRAIGTMWDPDEDASSLLLTPLDWELLKCLVDVLKPFEDAALLVTRPDATLCQALPLLWFLEEQLRALRTRYHQENNDAGAQLTSQALDRLVGDSRLRELKNSMVCRAAAFLDPRFRDITTMKLGGAHTADTTLLREHLTDLVARSYVPPGLGAHSSQAGRLSPQQLGASGGRTGPAAWQFTMKRWRAIAKSEPAVGLAGEEGAAAARREVEAYLHDDVDHVGENASPVLYWQEKRGVWPALFRVAVFHFGCPPSLVLPKGLSGTAGCPKNLSPANVKMLTFIRRNRHLLPPDWRLSSEDFSSSQSAMGSREDTDMGEEEDLLTMDDEEQEEEAE